MNESKYSYVTHMDALFNPLELIDVNSLVKSCRDEWYNQTLCQVNGSVVRLGIVRGEYHWHKHNDEDEFFLTLDGVLTIDIEGSESVELHPLHGYVVPRGVVHRTRAQERTVILMVETAGVIPAGDA